MHGERVKFVCIYLIQWSFFII